MKPLKSYEIRKGFLDYFQGLYFYAIVFIFFIIKNNTILFSLSYFSRDFLLVKISMLALIHNKKTIEAKITIPRNKVLIFKGFQEPYQLLTITMSNDKGYRK